METFSRQLGIKGDHLDEASQCAATVALTRELAAVQYHLAAIECLLGLRVSIAVPDCCLQRSCSTAQDHDPLSGLPSSRVATTLTDSLSRRETEILRLLAVGRSNSQIARALHISPRTVQRHVANIYLKIGAHSRAEAATFATDHGLR